MVASNIQPIFGYRQVQYITAIAGTLGIISCEMHFGWASPSIPLLTSGNYRIKITSDEGSWLAVILLFGTITGCFAAGFLNGVIGRKKIILFCSIPLLLGWLMIGFAQSMITLFIARYIAGISDGLCFSTVPLYLGEIAEPSIRGLISSLCPVFLVFGILLVNALGNYLPIDTAAFISATLPLIQVIVFVWMPESPTYLLLKGKHQEAQRALHILRGEEAGDRELERLTNAYKEERQEVTTFLRLFSTRINRKTMFIIIGLRTLQQLCGSTAIVLYCKTIFQEARDFISPNIGTIIYFSLQLFMVAISSFVVDITGRRALLLISTIGTSISLFITGTYIYLKNSTEVDTSSFTYLPLIGLLGFVVFFSIGIQTMPFIMTSEIFSPEVKPRAVSFASIYNNCIAIITSKFYHFSNDKYGMHISFFFFGCCCIVGIIWSYLFMPETKGKTLEDIQRQLKGEPLLDNKTE